MSNSESLGQCGVTDCSADRFDLLVVTLNDNSTRVIVSNISRGSHILASLNADNPSSERPMVFTVYPMSTARWLTMNDHYRWTVGGHGSQVLAVNWTHDCTIDEAMQALHYAFEDWSGRDAIKSDLHRMLGQCTEYIVTEWVRVPEPEPWKKHQLAATVVRCKDDRSLVLLTNPCVYDSGVMIVKEHFITGDDRGAVRIKHTSTSGSLTQGAGYIQLYQSDIDMTNTAPSISAGEILDDLLANGATDESVERFERAAKGLYELSLNPHSEAPARHHSVVTIANSKTASREVNNRG